jgi:hypothetical protein
MKKGFVFAVLLESVLTLGYSEPVQWNVNNLATWIEAVGGIRSAGDNNSHIIKLTGTISIPPTTASENTFGSSGNLTITLEGNGTITVSSTNGNLLRIGKGQKVTVKDVTLKGLKNNEGSLIISSGDFVMEGYAMITGNEKTGSNSAGGGVRIDDGTFTMKDNAAVKNNSAGSGGGVRIEQGTFIMKDKATVSDNLRGSGVSVGGIFIMQDNTTVMRNIDSAGNGGGVYVGYAGGFSTKKGNFTMQGNSIVSDNSAKNGGGVYIAAGNFTMQDNAIVSGNTATGSSGYEGGGGVYAGDSGIFTMRDNAVLKGNTALSYGGGVYIGGGGFSSGDFFMEGGTMSGNTAVKGGGVYVGGRAGTFTMKDGIISGNNAKTSGKNSGDGGGVYGAEIGTINLQGGTISGNTAAADGGGIYFDFTFAMQGGIISGNSAGRNGGGVYIGPGFNRITFTKTEGIIYGNDEVNNLKNTSGSRQGHALYRNSGPQWRNVTANQAMNHDAYGFWLND